MKKELVKLAKHLKKSGLSVEFRKSFKFNKQVCRGLARRILW